MRKRKITCDMDPDFEDAFDATDPEATTHCKPEEMTLIEALDTIRSASFRSKLSDKLWEDCKIEFEYLRLHTGLNNRQLVVLACLCEAGDGLSWRGLGEQLGLSRLKTMSLSPDIEDMKEKRWIVPYGIEEFGNFFEGFKQVPGIITAFKNNREFTPEVLNGFSEQAFMDRLATFVTTECRDSSVPKEAYDWWLLHFAQCNPQLPVCETVLSLEDNMSKIILLKMLADFAIVGGEPNEGLRLSDIDSFFADGWQLNNCLHSLKDDTHELIVRGIIEHACVDGLADQELFRLTRESKENLLSEFVRFKKPSRREARVSSRDLLRHSSIRAKDLFYNTEVHKQIDRVSQILSPDGLPRIQERLESLGHRKGCAILFYGLPGTGKTETVLQLARQSGRDVMQVNIAGIRDKFVGESEKNIKNIFSRYKSLCRNATPMPILLFNEADALINSRFETTNSSVEKMDNAIQNIILQELESLEGILIATTNLTGTLDKAFDRRFLFKIEFTKPSVEAKMAIWKNKLPFISEQQSLELAQKFDFSGGQIENIARKAEIEYVISGAQSTLEQIIEFCKEEHLNRNERSRIGF